MISASSSVGVAIGFGIGVAIEEGGFPMPFGHEQLDVYRAAIEYVGWAYRLCTELNGHRNAKDQLLRASQAIPLNIAEGNGKATSGDRRRFFEIARGSALECAAVQDVLEVCGAISSGDNEEAKRLLDRIVAMLTKLGNRGYSVREKAANYRAAVDDSERAGEARHSLPSGSQSGSGSMVDSDTDTDTDFDFDTDTDTDTEKKEHNAAR